MLKFYADESVDAQSSLLNVSGFLMREDQCLVLDKAVREARGTLPYFHMKDGHAVSYPDVYQKLLGLISKETVICGISASIFEKTHEALGSKKVSGQTLTYWTSKPYTYCLAHAMQVCGEAIDKYFPNLRDEYIAYVFEGGHPSQGDANRMFGDLDKQEFAQLKQFYRYASHAFVDGKGPLGSVLQLADIFAWQVNKADREGRPLEDVGRIFNVPIITKHHTAQEIYGTFVNQMRAWARRNQEKEERRLRQRINRAKQFRP